MLWLCCSLPHLPVDLGDHRLDAPVAVSDRLRSRRHIVAANTCALAAQVVRGLDATVALARCPTLKLIDRAPVDERRALKGLAGWAAQFTGEVCFDAERWLLWLEIGGSLTYFGGLETLRGALCEGLSSLGYRACTGIAPTLEAAALFTQSAAAAAVMEVSALRRALGAEPIGSLALPAEIVDHLRATGLERIEEVFAIPAADLARRFGEAVPQYLQRLLGTRPDPRPRYRSPARYRRRYDCADPIASVEGLLFPLQRILKELQGYLRGRDCALQLLKIRLRHRSAPDSVLEVRTSSPQREAVRLFVLVRERLERLTLPEPVTEMHFAVDELLAPDIVQSDLFDEAQRQDAGWSAVLDKLRARLGEQAVRRLGLADDHRPEFAWVGISAGDAVLEAGHPERPLWLMEPRPIGRLPPICGTPERIEAGWWSGADEQRDYYIAQTEKGECWWLFRDAQTQRWYLHGLWG